MDKVRLQKLAGVKEVIVETMWGDDEIEDLFQGIKKLAAVHNVPDPDAFIADVLKLIQHEIGTD